MESSVLVLKGPSKYNVLRRATDEIVKGFEACGYKVLVVDVLASMEAGDILEYLLKPYDFIFSMQAVLFELSLKDGRFLLDLNQTDWVGWTFDDLLYHIPRLQQTTRNHVHMLTVDGAMLKVAHMMYPQTKNIGHLLHGGFEGNARAKDIDIFMSGSIGEVPDWGDYQPMEVERYLAEEAISCMRANRNLTPRQALSLVLTKLGESMDGKMLCELEYVIDYLIRWVRYECKYQLITNLLEAGYHLCIAGEGHNQMAEKYEQQITWLGVTDVDETVDYIARSKIVINPLMQVFAEGMHERIFTALLNRAVCFTPYSEFIYRQLGNRVEYIDMDCIPKMFARIDAILADYDSVQEQLESNYCYAKENHSWQKRGEQIVEYMKGVRK